MKYFEPMGIHFYPMVAPEHDVFPKDIDWLHPIHVPELWRVSREIPGEACFRKINDFLDTQEINDDDYYGFMTDDDMYEPGFFDVIRQQTAKIIIYSLYRGDSIPYDEIAAPHPTTPLIMNGHGDVRVCNIGLLQYIIKGEIFKQTRFSTTDYWGDGHFAVDLKTRWPNEVRYIPDLWAFGGYFQPGRYTRSDLLRKPAWKLPEII